jgi:WD40 repeat protein
VAALPNQRGQVDLINIENGLHLQTYFLPNTQIVDFAFRPDQKTVATLDDTNMITFWDIQTQNILYQTVLSEYVLPPFAFSPNGSALFFTTSGDTVLTLQQFSGKLLSVGENHYFFGAADPYIHSKYYFSQEGHLILFNPKTAYVEMIDTFTKQSQNIPFESVNEKRYLEVEAYALNRDDNLVAFGTTANIFVWNIKTSQQLSMLAGHDGVGGDGFYGMIESVLFNPQSDLLVSVGWDGTTRLWNVHAGQELRRLNVCCQAQFTPDGRYLVTAGDGVLRVWGIPAPVP